MTRLLGADAQAIISCNQKLKDLGIDGTIKLPQICVIGDQSTGKSSLIEALSSIKVPKAKGVCTQCPIAINLSGGQTKTSPWFCVISIEHRYLYSQDPAKKKVTRTNPMGPWQLREQMTVEPFAETNNKDDLPELIRGAQAKILSPKTDGFSVPASNINSGAIKFSPNVIRLDVSEGGWPNLSFVDLPGVFSATDSKADGYLVQLVDNLAKHYATDENVVSMLTLPMNHDTANSKAFSLIQKAEASSRTLAVYTKTDLAHAEQRDQVLEKIKVPAREENFDHGYHIVMMTDNATTSEDARHIEASFFNVDPWINLPANLKTRLGIPSLMNYLRSILFAKTAESLPQNLENIRERLHHVETQLKGLPNPPNVGALPWKLQQSVYEFESQVKLLFTGEHGEGAGKSKQKLDKHVAIFCQHIAQTRPSVNIRTTAEAEEYQTLLKSNQRKNGTLNEPIDVESEEEQHLLPIKHEHKNDSTELVKVKFRLEEIRQMNNDHYKAYVPAGIELQAIDQLNKESVKLWGELLDKFMNRISNSVNAEIMRSIHMVFGVYKHLELYSVIQTSVKDYVDQVVQEEWASLEAMCAVESQSPATLNTVLLKSEEEKILKDRRGLRKNYRLKLLQEQQVHAAGGRKKKIDESQLPADDFDTEIQMSAKTSAYYKVASSRFIDNVYLSIIGRLLPRCRSKLVRHLQEHLGLENQNRHPQIALWMAEDPERERLRSRLRHEKDQLDEGYKYIEDVLGRRFDTSKDGDDTAMRLDPGTGMLSPPTSQTVLDSKRKADDAAEQDHPETPRAKRTRQTVHMTMADTQLEEFKPRTTTSTPTKQMRQGMQSIRLEE